jgi:DNA-directed RNA polymerase specialized sigma24 family protein
MTTAPRDPATVRFQDYQRLVHMLSHKLCGWASARGGRLDHDDVAQELAVIWVRCRDGFDPTRGVRFASYFARAAINHWSVLRRELDTQRSTISLDQSPSDDAEMTLAEVLSEADQLSPEEKLLRDEQLEATLTANPLLARLVQLSANPPPELHAQLTAIQAQAQWARELGVESLDAPPVALTPRLLGRTFRFNWRQRLLLQPQPPRAFP